MKPPIMNYNDQIKFNLEVDLIKDLGFSNHLLPVTSDRISELISAAKFLAYEEERARFSMELHDNFGQELNVLKGMVELLGLDALQQEQRRCILEEMLDVLKLLICETRTLAFNLSPSTFFDSDILGLFHQLFRRINLSCPGFIHFDLPAEIVFDLSQIQKQFIYRIVQEFISNSTKHSGSETIHVTVVASEKAFTLILKDKGCGFNLKKQRNGLGVSNIYKRLELLKADYIWQSSKKNGTNLTFTIYAK